MKVMCNLSRGARVALWSATVVLGGVLPLLLTYSNMAAQQLVLRARVDAAPGRPVEATDTAARFVTMPPGWHVNPGPGLILYDPSVQASGLFSIDAIAHFFPSPGSTEGVGLFFGGERLNTDAASYMVFLIRQDGRYQIAHRLGNETHVISPWKADTAVRVQSGNAPVANRLRVSVRPDSALFFVNERRVAALAVATQMVTSGGLGLRIGANANVHVTQLDLIRHLAPPR